MTDIFNMSGGMGVSDSGSSMDWEILRVRLEQAEARAMKAEARAMKAEVRAERAEARAERAEARAERAETRLENARRRAELAEQLLKTEKSMNRGSKVTAPVAMTDDTSVLSPPGPFDREVWELDSPSEDARTERPTTKTLKGKKKKNLMERERRKYISAEEAFETPENKDRSESRSLDGDTDLSSEKTMTDVHPDQFRNFRRKTFANDRRDSPTLGPRGHRRSPSLTPSESVNSVSNSISSVPSTVQYKSKQKRGDFVRHYSDSESQDFGGGRPDDDLCAHTRYRSNSVPVTRFDESTLASEVSISVVDAPPSQVARSIPGKLPSYYKSGRQLKIIGKKERFGLYKILGYRFSKSTAKITNKFIQLADGYRKFSDIPDWHLRKSYEDLRNRISYDIELTIRESEEATGYLQEICVFLCNSAKRREYDSSQAKLRGSRSGDMGGSSTSSDRKSAPREYRGSLNRKRKSKRTLRREVNVPIEKVRRTPRKSTWNSLQDEEKPPRKPTWNSLQDEDVRPSRKAGWNHRAKTRTRTNRGRQEDAYRERRDPARFRRPRYDHEGNTY